jgi:polar amino acid transport system substrate-binding protein
LPIIIALFLGLLPIQLFAASLTSANSNWPPWRVSESDGRMSGIDIDILNGLSDRLSLDLVTKSCGWKRCLKYMEVGEGDIMAGLFKTPEREVYMAFVEPPYRMTNNTCFYQNKYDTKEINNYQDLYKLTVGVVKKVAYFEPFDSDEKIKKHHATTGKNLFRLLNAQNIDAVIMGCHAGDVRIKDLGFTDEFKHANFVHRVGQPIHLAVSRKSPLFSRMDEISKALQSMSNEGEIKDIMASYGILNLE